MGSRITVRIEKKDNFVGLEKAIRELTKKEVLVGVPQEKSDRRSSLSLQDGISNAALAYIHDNGSPAQNIPPRPFFDPGVNDVKDQIITRMKAVAKAALARIHANIERGLHAIGLVAAAGVKNRINTGPFTPLSERTLKARKARGRTGEKPLVDTGQLRNAITYVIRDGKKE